MGHNRNAGAYLTRAVHLSDATLRFEIWDTAGSEKYHSVTPLYYRGAHAALLVYDVSQRKSFVRAQVWLRELEEQYVPGSTVVWLVGNKVDRAEGRQVSEQEGRSLAAERGLLFSETSALSGAQVPELLLAVADRDATCGSASQRRHLSSGVLLQSGTLNLWDHPLHGGPPPDTRAAGIHEEHLE